MLTRIAHELRRDETNICTPSTLPNEADIEATCRHTGTHGRRETVIEREIPIATRRDSERGAVQGTCSVDLRRRNASLTEGTRRGDPYRGPESSPSDRRDGRHPQPVLRLAAEIDAPLHDGAFCEIGVKRAAASCAGVTGASAVGTRRLGPFAPTWFSGGPPNQGLRTRSVRPGTRRFSGSRGPDSCGSRRHSHQRIGRRPRDGRSRSAEPPAASLGTRCSPSDELTWLRALARIVVVKRVFQGSCSMTSCKRQLSMSTSTPLPLEYAHIPAANRVEARETGDKQVDLSAAGLGSRRPDNWRRESPEGRDSSVPAPGKTIPKRHPKLRDLSAPSGVSEPGVGRRVMAVGPRPPSCPSSPRPPRPPSPPALGGYAGSSSQGRPSGGAAAGLLGCKGKQAGAQTRRRLGLVLGGAVFISPRLPSKRAFAAAARLPSVTIRP